MFTKPIDEIEFEDVESFCEEWAEGVCVEYKRDMNIRKQIPKIVSSFANTSGGIFLIGVDADQQNNRVDSIPGIPQRNGIEEQIQQSALTGIYPGVIPEIKLVDVPASGNVVVIIRVDESVQAPHAIEQSTKVYFRSGSITQLYKLELANVDRISYMLKRREDSQVFAQQIFNQIEERISNIDPAYKTIENTQHPFSNFPTFTVITRPVFPYRPLISASKIYESHQGPLWPPRRVTGGHFCYDEKGYWELNEYGIVYHRVVLFLQTGNGIDYGVFLWHINQLIKHANSLYIDCGYQGNIEVTARLRNVFGRELIDTESYSYGSKITENLHAEPMSFDTEVLASKQCLAHDLKDEKGRKDIVEELTCQLLWAFNIPIDNPKTKEKVRKRIERNS